eukprot:PLAT9765.1.p1 GENE.PLAT9765.1~~PLAT9765.1.p1  ORF type:complete len:1267 (-),score=577.64 PLAT9765.1:1432-5061(-)
MAASKHAQQRMRFMQLGGALSIMQSLAGADDGAGLSAPAAVLDVQARLVMHYSADRAIKRALGVDNSYARLLVQTLDQLIAVASPKDEEGVLTEDQLTLMLRLLSACVELAMDRVCREELGQMRAFDMLMRLNQLLTGVSHEVAEQLVTLGRQLEVELMKEDDNQRLFCQQRELMMYWLAALRVEPVGEGLTKLLVGLLHLLRLRDCVDAIVDEGAAPAVLKLFALHSADLLPGDGELAAAAEPATVRFNILLGILSTLIAHPTVTPLLRTRAALLQPLWTFMETCTDADTLRNLMKLLESMASSQLFPLAAARSIISTLQFLSDGGYLLDALLLQACVLLSPPVPFALAAADAEQLISLALQRLTKASPQPSPTMAQRLFAIVLGWSHVDISAMARLVAPALVGLLRSTVDAMADSDGEPPLHLLQPSTEVLLQLMETGHQWGLVMLGEGLLNLFSVAFANCEAAVRGGRLMLPSRDLPILHWHSSLLQLLEQLVDSESAVMTSSLVMRRPPICQQLLQVAETLRRTRVVTDKQAAEAAASGGVAVGSDERETEPSDLKGRPRGALSAALSRNESKLQRVVFRLCLAHGFHRRCIRKPEFVPLLVNCLSSQFDPAALAAASSLLMMVIGYHGSITALLSAKAAKAMASCFAHVQRLLKGMDKAIAASIASNLLHVIAKMVQEVEADLLFSMGDARRLCSVATHWLQLPLSRRPAFLHTCCYVLWRFSLVPGYLPFIQPLVVARAITSGDRPPTEGMCLVALALLHNCAASRNASVAAAVLARQRLSEDGAPQSVLTVLQALLRAPWLKRMPAALLLCVLHRMVPRAGVEDKEALRAVVADRLAAASAEAAEDGEPELVALLRALRTVDRMQLLKQVEAIVSRRGQVEEELTEMGMEASTDTLAHLRGRKRKAEEDAVAAGARSRLKLGTVVLDSAADAAALQARREAEVAWHMEEYSAAPLHGRQVRGEDIAVARRLPGVVHTDAGRKAAAAVPAADAVHGWPEGEDVVSVVEQEFRKLVKGRLRKHRAAAARVQAEEKRMAREARIAEMLEARPPSLRSPSPMPTTAAGSSYARMSLPSLHESRFHRYFPPADPPAASSAALYRGQASRATGGRAGDSSRFGDRSRLALSVSRASASVSGSGWLTPGGRSSKLPPRSSSRSAGRLALLNILSSGAAPSASSLAVPTARSGASSSRLAGDVRFTVTKV